MTREEAIKLLEHISIAYIPTDAYGDYDDPQPYEEAFDMAIEALKADVARWSSWNKTFEQSGIADLISRADAIEALCHNCAYYTDAQCKTDSGYWCESGAMIREAIPSAEFPKGDLISRRWLLDLYGDYIGDNGDPKYHVPLEVVRHNIIDAPSADAVQGWIPFTRRPMTEEEQEDYPNCTFIIDCVLPDDGDEILVSKGRFVWMDTFCTDIDGCYLDSGDDIDTDMAWMPLPTPYKGGENE